jgi:hypothetical protein
MLREQNRDDHLRGVSLDEREGRYIENLRDTPELRFYAGVQRSWRIMRATKAAHLTLSLLKEEERERLVNEWLDSSAGVYSFFHVEADLFLDFIGRHLSDRLRELTVCQFERATLRASDGANVFVAPDATALQSPDSRLRRGSYAAVVRFEADPLLDPPEPFTDLFSDGVTIMFSPGLPQLWHEPSADELDLWDALESPTPVSTLLSHGYSIETLARLLHHGAVEYTHP